MFRSFEIFRVLGIPVRVHSSLLFFLAVAGLVFGHGGGLAGILTTIIFLGLVFSFVLLHELGHAVVARANGVGVSRITLHPLGGIAALTHMPRDPNKEMAIAIAGPAVNFVLAGLFGAAYFLFPIELLRLLVIVNLVLGLFNLLPGFPMDGGRILRAWLDRRRPYDEATRIASRTGQVVAVLMGVVGLLTTHLMLVMIAVFIFVAAQAERTRTAWQSVQWSGGDGSSPYGTVVMPPDQWQGMRSGVRIRNK